MGSLVTPWLLRWEQAWPGPLLLTGNVPSERMCDSAFSMSGMLMDSAQSQSRRPSFIGSLGAKCQSYARTLLSPFGLIRLAYSLVLGQVKVVLVQHEAVWENVSEQPGEGCLAARGAAGHTHDDCLLVSHSHGGYDEIRCPFNQLGIVRLICRCKKMIEVEFDRAVRREGPRRLRRRTDAPTESRDKPGRAATPGLNKRQELDNSEDFFCLSFSPFIFSLLV